MSEELFDVIFFGILQAGKDKETVMQNMATMFKTDAAKLAPYFAGGRKVIKGKINAEAAEKYRTALENVGLVIKIEPCVADQSETPKESAQTKADSQATPAKEAASSINTGSITMAEVGVDVLENPIEVVAQKIEDISSITMADTGADVLQQHADVVAQKIEDISNISMAELGTDVLDQPTEVVAQKIDDISEISMAEAGAYIIANPKPKDKTPEPDISELSLDETKTEP